ncbi:MAG: mechanosensitive ion channel family protein [Candidatus Ozemobacteraceae bacterium]
MTDIHALTSPGFNAWVPTFIGGFVNIFLGLLFMRALGRKLNAADVSEKSLLAILHRAISLPFNLMILTYGFRLTLGFLPAESGRLAWLTGLDLALQFFIVLIIGETLFAFGIDYYLRERRNTEVPMIFSQLLKAIVYVIAGLSFLSTTYKIDITPLLTTSAVFTMVIGLALQDVLGNLFSGISVHISPPFKIGDWIRVGGYFGKVMESNWRATTLRTHAEEIIVLPNNDIAKKDIVNLSSTMGMLYLNFPIGLSYATSPDQAQNILRQSCFQVEKILKDPSPSIYLESFGDSSVNYRVWYWIAEPDKMSIIKDQLASRIWYRLKREGQTIPFPTREVFIHPEKDEKALITEHRLNLVTNIDFLADIDRPHRAFLAENLRELWFQGGETIFEKGAQETDFYIIDSGKIAVFIDERSLNPVAFLKSGEFFGEMSMLTGEPRSATIKAEEETRVLQMNRGIIEHVLKDNPNLAEVLSHAIAHRRLANVRREQDDQPIQNGTMEERARKEESEVSSQILERIKRFFRLC